MAELDSELRQYERLVVGACCHSIVQDLEHSVHVPLSSLPRGDIDQVLVKDALYVLQGFPGDHVSFQLDVDVAGQRVSAQPVVDAVLSSFPTHKHCLERLFPLASTFVTATQFVTTVSRSEHGRVLHALASAISELLNDYTRLISQLDEERKGGKMTLQSLWFFLQPSAVAFAALQRVIDGCRVVTFEGDEVDEDGGKTVSWRQGGDLINMLYSQYVSAVGDERQRKVLEVLLVRSTAPFVSMLQEWLIGGDVRDAAGEFMVRENDRNEKGEHVVNNDRCWVLQASNTPSFLAPLAERILSVGNYSRWARCARQPRSAEWSLESFSVSGFERLVEEVHRSSTRALVSHLREHCLDQMLFTFRDVFLMRNSGLFSNIMDEASRRSEKASSATTPMELSKELTVLLRAYHRVHYSTVVEQHAPFFESLAWKTVQLRIPDHATRCNFRSVAGNEAYLDVDYPLLQEESTGPPKELSPYEYQCLQCEVPWPLNIIIDPPAITKYQLLFRLLLKMYDTRRLLTESWVTLHAFRREHMLRSALTPLYCVGREMSAFVSTLSSYLSVDVIDAQCDSLCKSLQSAASVEHISTCHRTFIDVLIRLCFLSEGHLMKPVSKLLSVCDTYALYTKRLSNILVGNIGKSTTGSDVSREQADRLQADAKFSNTVAKFQTSFRGALAAFKKALSVFSQRPHFSGLNMLLVALEAPHE